MLLPPVDVIVAWIGVVLTHHLHSAVNLREAGLQNLDGIVRVVALEIGDAGRFVTGVFLGAEGADLAPVVGLLRADVVEPLSNHGELRKLLFDRIELDNLIQN